MQNSCICSHFGHLMRISNSLSCPFRHLCSNKTYYFRAACRSPCKGYNSIMFNTTFPFSFGNDPVKGFRDPQESLATAEKDQGEGSDIQDFPPGPMAKWAVQPLQMMGIWQPWLRSVGTNIVLRTSTVTQPLHTKYHIYSRNWESKGKKQSKVKVMFLPLYGACIMFTLARRVAIHRHFCR